VKAKIQVPEWALAVVKDAPPLMTRIEVAQILRTARTKSETPSARTVDRLIKRGALGAVHVGSRVLVPAAAVAAFLASRAEGL
jgi:excisionase family DNA binding protein